MNSLIRNLQINDCGCCLSYDFPHVQSLHITHLSRRVARYVIIEMSETTQDTSSHICIDANSADYDDIVPQVIVYSIERLDKQRMSILVRC
jgi:hypothetical protein